MPSTTGIFRALSDATRLRIVRLILAVDGSVCVCELVDALEMPQYQISRHLSVLKNAGLMHVTKQGTWGYHGLDAADPLLTALWTFLRTAPMSAEEEEQLRRDRRALELRLQLRENGACVVGLGANRTRRATEEGKNPAGKNGMSSMQ